MNPRASALLTVAIVLAVIACWVFWSPLGANDLVGGDEGFYGTSARNILAGGHYLVSPSVHPLGVPGDKPPLYPALLALSVAAFGPTESAVRWLSLLLAAGIAFGIATLVRRAAGGWAGFAAAGMLVMLPWFADASRSVAAEIPLTAFGTAALVALGDGPCTWRRSSLAGALLGLAFLCKLWLIALIALPLLAACWSVRGNRTAVILALVASAVLVAALHLLAVAVFEIGSLAHWWSIYMGFSLTGRVAGDGYAEYWFKPPGYYWGVLTHAYVLLLPLVLCGAVDGVRRFREPGPRALLLWAAGVLLLSGFAVKSFGYTYVVFPAWAALAGLGVAALAARRMPPHWATALAVLATFPALVTRVSGVEPSTGLWLAGWLAFALTRVFAHRKPSWSPAIAAALALVLTVPALAREAGRMPFRYHVPGYRAVAAAVAPQLAGVPPSRVCFVAPEAPAFEYYLFRTGTYWSSPYIPWTAGRRARLEADTTLRVFIVDRARRWYGGAADSAMVSWLEASTTEVSRPAGESAGWSPGLRVFVRR